MHGDMYAGALVSDCTVKDGKWLPAELSDMPYYPTGILDWAVDAVLYLRALASDSVICAGGIAFALP